LTAATYQSMMTELNTILQSLERDSVSVDELSKKLEEAYVLVEKLKERLFVTETRIEEIIDTRRSSANSTQSSESD
jgi:exodeoxyribonuclease VII small subunit